jgi:ribosomal protein S18 acetylase RimI-like enzyme
VLRETTCTRIALRPAKHDGPENDLELLFRVYAEARAEELAQVVGWSADEKAAFLRSQFSLQHAHYHEHFPEARYQVICEEGRPIGRLYVDRSDREMRVMDVALLPEYRGRGIGGALIADVLAEAEAARLPVLLHVEATNPARRLYERLGFRFAEDVGVYQRMEWTPRARI